MIRALVILATLLHGVAFGFTGNGVKGQNGALTTRTVNIYDYTPACDGVTDDTTAFQNAATAAAGQTLLIPSGCMLRLASPGAGNAVVTLATRTKIVCEDESAGFDLATKVCTGGSSSGAGCSADADCIGGTCTGTAFAGNCTDATCTSNGNTYTVLSAAAASADVQVMRCRFNINGRDTYNRCTGTGARAGKPCTTNDNTNATTGCPTNGACTADTGIPSGAGKINPVDFRNVTNSPYVGWTRLWDMRRADFAIAVGTGALGGSLVEWNITNDYTTIIWPFSILTQPTTTITTGIKADTVGYNGVSHNVTTGSTYGIAVSGALLGQGPGADVVANNVYNTGASTAAFYATNWHVRIIGGNAFSTANCLVGDGITTTDVSMVGTHCVSNSGPAVIISGTGFNIKGGYVSGLPPLQIGTTDVSTGVNHALIAGVELAIGSGTGGAVTFVDMGKRCNAGSKQGQTCTNSNTTDCPGATCGTCCATTAYTDVKVLDDMFFVGSHAIDASTLTGGNTSISRLEVVGNTIGNTNTADMAFPTNTALASGVAVVANPHMTLTNWSDLFGMEQGNSYAVGDQQTPTRLQLTGSGTLATGDVVIVDSAANNQFKRAPATILATEAIAGISLDGVNQIASAGSIEACTVDSSVTRGDRLRRSGTAGKYKTAAGGEPANAIALTTSSTSVRCLMVATGPLLPYTFPTTDGSANQVLQTAGSGTLASPSALSFTTSGADIGFALCGHTDSTISASLSRYFMMGAQSTTENIVSVPVPVGGTLQKLYCAIDTGTLGGTATYTAFVNGSSTAITCNDASTTCNDTTHTVSLTAGDKVSIQITTGTGASGNAHKCCLLVK